MITNNDIRRYLGLPKSSHEFWIYQVDSLGVNRNTLMFHTSFMFDWPEIDKSSSCVVLTKHSVPPSEKNDFITVDNPKYAFCKIVEHFCLKSKFQKMIIPQYDTKPTEYCDECVIGEGCQFDEGVIIGGTDFSPVMGEDRYHLVQFPQMGGVMIGDNVVIKYNSMVGKGTFGFTTIGDNTMIDYNCQVGHNCQVGKSCIIAAGTIISGSTIIGDCCNIGAGAKIRNGLKIGNNVSIGIGAVVIRDIPDNCVVVGNPARVIDHNPIFDERGLI